MHLGAKSCGCVCSVGKTVSWEYNLRLQRSLQIVFAATFCFCLLVFVSSAAWTVSKAQDVRSLPGSGLHDAAAPVPARTELEQGVPGEGKGGE